MEYDISFWFLGFFALFFAMIIGDAGYGCLFLLLALVLTLKGKKKSNAVQLLWVLSIATIIIATIILYGARSQVPGSAWSRPWMCRCFEV